MFLFLAAMPIPMSGVTNTAEASISIELPDVHINPERHYPQYWDYDYRGYRNCESYWHYGHRHNPCRDAWHEHERYRGRGRHRGWYR